MTVHHSHMRLVQGYVDCLSPNVHQKSLIRLMLRVHYLSHNYNSLHPICSLHFALTCSCTEARHDKRFVPVVNSTPHTSLSHAVNTYSLLHITLHGSRMCWSASSSMSCGVRSLTLCSSLCSFPCVSPISFFFYLNLELNLFLHVAVIGATYHWHSASNGTLMTSTTMTQPSAKRSSTRAEDMSITLKKKACRPVCRRQSVIIERGDPLFAQVSSAQKNLRDTPLRLNRLELSWSDKESKYSLTVKRRFETRIPSRLRPTKYTKIE